MNPNITLFDGAAWYAVFLFSTCVHEASHSLVALKLGDDTAHRGGQVSLDPTPHIKREPLGLVVVPLISYFLGGWMIGWASAPYDPSWAHRHPRKAGLMALAGPVSNFVLLVICALLIKLGIQLDYFTPPGRVTFGEVVTSTQGGLFELAAILLSIGFSMNLLLFLFNLLPLPPLDGSSILLIFLPEEGGRKLWEVLRNPAFSFLGIFIAWKLFGFIYPPAHHLAIRLLYPGMYS